MEEKERYKYYVEINQLYDSEEDELYAYNLNNNKVISILNQQDKKIKELKEELEMVHENCHDMNYEMFKLMVKVTDLGQENQQLKEQLTNKEKFSNT